MAVVMRGEGPTTRRASVPNSTTTTLGTAGVLEPAAGTIAENADRALIVVQNHGAVGERIRVSYGNDTATGTRGFVLQGDAKWWVHGSQEHLHDLSADPGERDDLASAPEHRTEPWVQRLATALAQPVLPVWRIQGQGLRKTTSQRQGSVTVSHPGGFVQAWSTPGIKRQTAEPQLTPGGAVVTASKQLPVPREWYVQPSALDASPQGLTLVVERGEQRWQASVGEGAHPGGLLLEAGEGELSYQITRAWAPRFEQETETELDAETREQLRVLGYVE